MATTDNAKTLRAAAILTNDYVATDPLQVANSSRAVFFLDFTIGSLTKLQYYVEFAPDGTDDWYPETAESIAAIAAGESVVTTGAMIRELAQTQKVRVPVDLGGEARVRLQVKGVGTVTDSSLAVRGSEGNDD